MRNVIYFYLENRKTGEKFDCYAYDIWEAQKYAVETCGDNAEDWQEAPMNGFYK